MDVETKPPLIHLTPPTPTPTLNSTIPELISYLRSTQHFDLVTNLLLGREENLKNSVKEMSAEVVKGKKGLELMETKHRQLVLEKVAIEEELKKCRKEEDKVRDELKHCRYECEEFREKMVRSGEELSVYVGREKRAVERYEKLIEDSREAESSLKKKIMELSDQIDGLRKEKIRAETEAQAWKNKYEDMNQRIFKLEEDIAGLVVDGEECLGADFHGKNHVNGKAVNKQFVLDSRSPTQMMDSPIIGSAKSASQMTATPIIGSVNSVIIELDDSDDDKPSGNGKATISVSEASAEKTCKKVGSVQNGEKDNKGHKESAVPQPIPNRKRALSSEILEANNGQHKMRSLQQMGQDPKVLANPGLPIPTLDSGGPNILHPSCHNLASVPPCEESSGKRYKQKVSCNSSDSGGKSLTDSYRDNLITNSKRERERERESKEWKYEVDMIQAFMNDLEICMNAVCALYRQQKKSSNQGFSQFDVLSGTKLAEMLIDGDPDGKLRKSASDLPLRSQNECRKLAINYSKQLFQIYKNNKDPFFFPS